MPWPNACATKIDAVMISPGVRIVEGTWGRKLGVAQASVREAINILAHEGFVTKASGRSARVVSLSEQDVLQLFDLRGALERSRGAPGGSARRGHRSTGACPGTNAARLALRQLRSRFSTRIVNFTWSSAIFQAILICNNTRAGYCCRSSHSSVCGWSTTEQSTSPWHRGLDAHQRIVDLVREREGEVAEQYVRRLMARFGATAYQDWQKAPPQKKTPLRKTQIVQRHYFETA